MSSSPILLLGSDRDDRNLLAGVVQRMGHPVAAYGDVETALVAAADHHLVIIDLAQRAEEATAVCRAIRSAPGMSAVAILCIAESDDVEARVAFLEAGADDVIAKPFDARELEARIEALLLRFRHTRTIAAPPSGPQPPARRSVGSQVVALFSPKGGVGTTTIAVNLATVLARGRQWPAQVAIADLDLQWGQVATQLNLSPRMTIVDLAHDPAVWDEPEAARAFAAGHESGLVVYAASLRPDQAQTVGADDVRRVIAGVRGLHERLIVDAGSVLDDRTLTMLEVADTVIIPMAPEIPTLRIVHALLEFLSEAGGILGKTMFVVNHLYAKEMVRLRDIESAVQARVSLELPYDATTYLRAANEGIPVVIGAPKSLAAQRFGELAAAVTAAAGGVDNAAGAASGPEAGGAETDRRGRLTGLLKRG